MATARIHRLSLGLFLWLITLSLGAFVSTAAAKDEQSAEGVQLKSVVLFTSGVGYFEHAGQVDGSAQIELKFNVEDINDLLKSMVLQDLGGGQISTVTYGSRDPITKTLQTFAIDLTANPTLSQLLAQIRGERIEIDAPNRVAGIILGVERRMTLVGKDEARTVDVLNLLTDEGLRSVSLEQVGRIKLASEELDAELRQALVILAMGHSTDKKSVTLNFLGQGQRQVRVGYIQETPIWKTSYRLVLHTDHKPLLQGWAIMENTTEFDWKDVQLTLVSGRPISFSMDLYRPMYVQRPNVVPELYSSLGPRVYDQDLGPTEEEGRKLAERRRGGVDGRGGFGGGGFGGGGGGGGGAPASDEGQPDIEPSLSVVMPSKEAGEATAASAERRLYFGEGVASLARGEETGEVFQYAISTPVALERHQSAMLPIVNDSIEVEKLSIYNASVHERHPLSGLQLTNSTKLYLMQGPITLFDDGTYAGDAQIGDLPPGAKRLVSYALDLDVEVSRQSEQEPEELVSVRLVKGTLHSTHKQARKLTYTVKNSGQQAKKVLVEHPLDASWELTAPKEPAEKTRDLYRFAVDAQPGRTTELLVQEEHMLNQQVAMTDLDDGTIEVYLRAKTVSDAVRKALAVLAARKQEIGKLVKDREQLQARIEEIAKDQQRMRDNMGRLPANSDIYNRYIKKFSDQEDQIEAHRQRIQELSADETHKRQALAEYLLNLDLS